MLRLVLYLLAVSALAFGLSWLADRPGSLVVQWQGYDIETSVFRAIVILAVVLGLVVVFWTALRQIWHSPAAIGRFFNRRRQKRGLEALSSGMIAIGAGDRTLATRYAIQARKSLPNEPLTHLLRAQAAQLSGDRGTSRRIFEAMLATPDTEQLGLRGLFLEAEREGEREAARQFAERAMALNPKLGWPVEALFEIQCREADWDGALQTLGVARRHHHVERAAADRRRGVLLAAQAQEIEDSDPERAMTLAVEAHGLAPDLVPAAAIAGRVLAAKGNTPRAARVLQRTWKRSPHPDIATAYAYARIGDSPRDRLDRARQLAALRPHSMESGIAVATAAIEARDWASARHALQPLLSAAPTQRACTLMARIEAEQHGDKGRVREWLARAVSAPRDPAWTADGVVSERWAPISPVTGALDAFQWRVPVEAMDKTDATLLGQKIEELMKLGAPREAAIGPAPMLAAAPDAPAPGPEARAAAEAEIIEVVTRPEPPARQEPEPPAPPRAETDQQSAPAAPPSETASEPEKPAHAKPPAEPAEPAREAAAARSAVADEARAAGEAQQAGAPVRRHPRPDRKASARPAEPRLFVPLRAPDDPGPDPAEGGEDVRPSPLAFHLPMKGSA
ncbi:MAG: heme biosynthesis protein HemY [Hyphomicrobiaceae bacterium]|nr:heme biosynthesis protein HemY [Hyphomicrobiaceae bacterium]